MTLDEIIAKLRDMARYPTVTLPRDTEALKKAADLLEKAALETKDKPVAWRYDLQNVTPLYTRPQPAEPVIDESAAKRIATALGWEPKREWVGLTRMELIKCGVLPFGMSYELCKAIQAKLKEKNT